MLKLQIEIFYFCLTFSLPSANFKGNLNYASFVGWQEIKFQTITAWKILNLNLQLNYMPEL